METKAKPEIHDQDTMMPFPDEVLPPVPGEPMPPPEKPTWQSTEFWSGIMGNLIGILVLLGVFDVGQGSDLADAFERISGAVIVAVTNGGYAISRGLAKKK